MKNESIQEYILKSPENLRIAAAVGEAWPDVRELMVSDFLARLDSKLKEKLKGWESGKWEGRFFVNAYPGYSIWKREKWHHAIGLQCSEYGAQMHFGVVRETDNKEKLPLNPSILHAVQKIHASAVSNRWWEAKVLMHSPEPDWRKPEVLWRMHTDPSLLESVLEQLLEIAIICEPMLDKIMQQEK